MPRDRDLPETRVDEPAPGEAPKQAEKMRDAAPPEPTDNSPAPEDGPQDDLSQSPRSAYDADGDPIGTD